MTTPAAEKLYRAQHEFSMDGKGYAIFNPHGKELSELPVIYGFNNGGSNGWYSAVLLAQDGTHLGGHACSHECYMEHDLGIFEGTRPDRHEKDFKAHYPDGYRMDFVHGDEVEGHEALGAAYRLNQAKANSSPEVSTQPVSEQPR